MNCCFWFEYALGAITSFVLSLVSLPCWAGEKQRDELNSQEVDTANDRLTEQQSVSTHEHHARQNVRKYKSARRTTTTRSQSSDQYNFASQSQIITNHRQSFDRRKHTRPIILVKIGEWEGRVLVDTGTEITLMSTKLLKDVGGRPQKCANKYLFGISGSIQCHSFLRTDIELLGHKIPNQLVYFVENSALDKDINALIGTCAMSQLPPLSIDWQNGHIYALPHQLSHIMPTFPIPNHHVCFLKIYFIFCFIADIIEQYYSRKEYH